MFDRGDETATDLILQALAFAQPPLLHEGAKSRPEYIGEAAAWRGRQAMQQNARRLIGSQDAARIVDPDEACCKRMQLLTAIVKGDQDVAMVALPKQPVLDLRRGHANEGSGMGLAGDAIGRGVKDASERTIRRKKRRCSARK